MCARGRAPSCNQLEHKMDRISEKRIREGNEVSTFCYRRGGRRRGLHGGGIGDGAGYRGPGDRRVLTRRCSGGYWIPAAARTEAPSSAPAGGRHACWRPPGARMEAASTRPAGETRRELGTRAGRGRRERRLGEAKPRHRRRGQRPQQGGAGRASREGTARCERPGRAGDGTPSAAGRAPSQVAGRRRARFQGGSEGERRLGAGASVQEPIRRCSFLFEDAQ